MSFRERKAKPAIKVSGDRGASRDRVMPAEPVQLSAESETLAARIRDWRAAEAKRLKVPAYVVLHDRTLTALAQSRPKNPRELLAIDGMGPARVERFGEALLGLCSER